MEELKEFAFVDWLFIDFKVGILLSSLELILEAYYPLQQDNSREKGLIKLNFSGIKKIALEKNSEFDLDIYKPYDSSGDDTKANELYLVQVNNVENGLIQGIIHSDMINIELQTDSFTLSKVN